MATTARFTGVAGKGELLSVRFQANSMIQLTERMTGYFRGGEFQRVLADVHTTAAMKIQQGMVDVLQRKIKDRPGGMRPQREGARLETALLDERNRDVSASGYWVLRRSWMDESPAELYWRRIEEGDPKTFDSYILFTTDFQTFVGPYSPGGQSSTQGRQRARAKGPGHYDAQGYPHMRMPQHAGAFVRDIGPFPAHQFTEGGRRAMEQFDILGAYERGLKAIGLSLQEVRR